MLATRAGRFEYIGLAQSLEYVISPECARHGRDRGRRTCTNPSLPGRRGCDPGRHARARQHRHRQRPAGPAARRAGGDPRELQARESGQDIADRTADLRRFQIDEEQRRLSMLELEVIIESDQIEAERRGIEVRRAEQLLDVGLVSRSDYDIEKLTLGAGSRAPGPEPRTPGTDRGGVPDRPAAPPGVPGQDAPATRQRAGARPAAGLDRRRGGETARDPPATGIVGAAQPGLRDK